MASNLFIAFAQDSRVYPSCRARHFVRISSARRSSLTASTFQAKLIHTAFRPGLCCLCSMIWLSVYSLLTVRIWHPSGNLAHNMKLDPFRPESPPINPMIINAIQDVLRAERGCSLRVAEEAIDRRKADPDYVLTSEEETHLKMMVQKIDVARDELFHVLKEATDQTPWIHKFGCSNDFGVGSEEDVYNHACRAECLLAILIIHFTDGTVDFLDDERLQVLNLAPSPSSRAAVKVALSKL